MEITNKIEFENNCWVGLVDSSKFNSSEEHRIRAVTDMASITKGRLGFPESVMVYGNNHKLSKPRITEKRRETLYNRLLTESAGKPSTPFEFVPVIHSQDFFDKDVFNNILKYSYMTMYSNQATLLSNYRMVLNQTQGWDLNPPCQEEIDKSVHYDDFKVIVGRVPMKVLTHLVRHRAFSWLVESSRNKKYLNEVEFWYPSWWSANLMSEKVMSDSRALVEQKALVECMGMKPEEATMELSDRRLVTFAMCAWKQDTDAWDNLFAVRGKGTGTQSITGKVVDNIKTLVDV